MRRTLLFLSAFVAFAFLPHFADAQTVPAAGLVKGSGSAVYYIGFDNKRYVFPNDKTYFTWYSDFSSVTTISDTALAYYQIAANVTYRPGVKMIKIESDPKVYAVAKGGVLRWVESEAVATELYGADWNKKIDDVSVAFFVNYLLGASISNASDFDPAAETALVPNIDANRLVPQPTPDPTPTPTSTPPTPEPTKIGELTYTPETIGVNQTFTLIGTAMPSTGIQYVDIYFNGFLMRRCEYSPCGADVSMPGDRMSSTAVAEFIWADGLRYMTTSTIEANAADPSIRVTITRPEIEPGTQREIIVDVDSTFVATTTDIYLDGNNVRGCDGVQQCRYTAEETSPVGTVHTVYAIAKDANGFSRQSGLQTFTVVENAKPLVTISVGKTLMYAGESVDVTVSASDDDNVEWTEIRTDDDILIKTCQTGLCTTSVTRETSGVFHFVGRAMDALGAIGSAVSDEITVQ